MIITRHFRSSMRTSPKSCVRRSRTDTAPVIMQGEAILGIEAAAGALISKNDVVLNLVSGVYGKGFAIWAARYGKEVIELAVPYDDVIDPQAIREVLRKRPDISVVALCHHDTPSGTLNPLHEIGAIVAEHGAYLIVDAVSSFGGMNAHPQEAHADIFITSPSKCLGSTPGLSLIAMSERAWAKIETNPDAPRRLIPQPSCLEGCIGSRKAFSGNAFHRRDLCAERRARPLCERRVPKTCGPAMR